MRCIYCYHYVNPGDVLPLDDIGVENPLPPLVPLFDNGDGNGLELADIPPRPLFICVADGDDWGIPRIGVPAVVEMPLIVSSVSLLPLTDNGARRTPRPRATALLPLFANEPLDDDDDDDATAPDALPGGVL